MNIHMTTIREVHIWASSFLKKHGIPTPELEAEIIIREIFNWERTQFFISLNQRIEQEQIQKIEKLIQRRVEHEPLQYIIGNQSFYGREFKVNQNVLIPRPETELLIEEVIKAGEKRFGEKSISVIDIGTGSGAIGITLALEKINWHIHTIDISPSALDIARENAKALKADLQFHLGNVLEPAFEKGIKADIIVSNPPYIPSRDIEDLMPEVRNHEPILALDGGLDGLNFYRTIINQGSVLINKPGIMAFEIGIDQEEAIEDLLRNSGANDVTIINDFQDIPRIIIAHF